jgi:predicted deacylase
MLIGVLALTALVVAADADSSPRGAAFAIGRSVEDRPIEARQLGDRSAGLKVLVVGSIHGDERQGQRIVRRLRRHYADGVKGAAIWTVTTVNPDGVAADERRNAHGVDLNRNFAHRFDPDLDGGYNSGPRPFSEPESRAVKRLSKRVDFDLAIWYHQPWGVTLIPCNSTASVARSYARLSGLPASRRCDGYSPGSAISWQHHRFRTTAFVAELPGRRLHNREVRRHARAVVNLIRKLR